MRNEDRFGTVCYNLNQWKEMQLQIRQRTAHIFMLIFIGGLRNFPTIPEELCISMKKSSHVTKKNNQLFF